MIRALVWFILSPPSILFLTRSYFLSNLIHFLDLEMLCDLPFSVLLLSFSCLILISQMVPELFHYVCTACTYCSVFSTFPWTSTLKCTFPLTHIPRHKLFHCLCDELANWWRNVDTVAPAQIFAIRGKDVPTPMCLLSWSPEDESSGLLCEIWYRQGFFFLNKMCAEWMTSPDFQVFSMQAPN